MIRTIMSHPRTRQAGVLGALAAALLLTQAAQADTKVGVTAAVNPEATGKPPSSNERVLYVGVDMQADERVRTTANGRVQLLFLDGSALSIGPNSDVVIDKYVYNPDNADNPGELAFRATKGVFRLIGGKISKVNPVVMHTSTASIGVRGSGALINAPEGNAKSTAVFMHGKDMFVRCDKGGCQGEKQVVTRPGSAIDFAAGLLSSPYLAKLDQIKAILGGFEKPGGLGEISPAAGPGGPGGGGTPDDKLAATNIAANNSTSTGNALVLPPTGPSNTSKVDQTTQDAVSNSSSDTSAESTANGQNNQGNVTPPPPPPPPPAVFTGSFTQGRFARSPVGSGFVNTTLAFTPDPANYTPITSAEAIDGGGGISNLHITLPSNEVLDLPALVGQFGWTTYTGTQESPTFINAGFGFAAADNSFFRLWGFEFPTQATPRVFEVFGGTPTAVFPTAGFATHQVLPLFAASAANVSVSLALLPFLNTDIFSTDPNVNIPLTLHIGQTGVTVSPLYSAFAPIPISGVASATDARPVTLQGTLAIIGTGATQSSLIMGGTGTYVRETAESDVAMTGAAVGSYRSAGSAVPTRFIAGTTTQLTAGGNSIFGPDAEFIVVGPDLIQRVGTDTPATVARQTSLGFAQPLDNLTGSSYFYQTTFQKVDPSASVTIGSNLNLQSAADIGQSRTGGVLSGYVAGMADVRLSGGTLIQPLFQGPQVVGDALPVQITLDPATNRMTATFKLESQVIEGTDSMELQFGSLTGFNGASSAYIDDKRFGASDSPTSTAQSTFNGTPVKAQLFMVTNAAMPVDPNSAFLSGVTLCSCQYLQWGWWTGDLNHNDENDPRLGERDRAHLATWVAGSLPAISEIPNTGTATFGGHIIGNVVNGTSSYLAAGNFNHNWDFATRSGALFNSTFDGMALTGSASATVANPRDFNGTLNLANGASGAYNGSFFKGGGDPTKAIGGQFNLANGSYVAGGTFAAQKTP